MLRYFRRRRPQHRAATITPQDRVIAAHHRLTPEQWAALPALAKQDLRESVAWELRAAS